MSVHITEDLPVGTGVLLEPEFTEECVEEVEYEEDFFGNSEPPAKRQKSSYTFPISEASAHAIYMKSGSLVHPVNGDLNIYPAAVKFENHIKIAIEEVRSELNLSFTFNDMQEHALHSMASGHDVLVNAPCGSGKMAIFFAGVLLLRKIRQMPKGFGIILEPLVSISEEKRKNAPPLPIAFINVKGTIKISDNILDVSDDRLKDISEGKFPVIFMSSEAALTDKGLMLVKSWRKSLLVVCTDEAQLYTDDQWGSSTFRGDMNRAPGKVLN